MPMPDSTLTAIRNKVRRLTRSPSEAQLSTNLIDEYINTFLLYDVPEHLRLFNLHSTFTLYTQPFIAEYNTATEDVNDQLYQFDQLYITINPPVYVSGFQAYISQSPQQFYSLYPNLRSIQSIGTKGDGFTSSYTGTLSARPLLRNHVLFNSINSSSEGLELHDDGEGNLIGDGTGSIDYITGIYTFSFDEPPAEGADINSQTVPYTPARPLGMLFYDAKIVLRPVPDQVYTVNFEVYKRPTVLLESGQSPLLQEWWQWIALGAAKKVFEDRLDMDSVALLLPEYKEQEYLVQRRTIQQQSTERASTIYSQQTDPGSYGGWWGPNGGPFW